MDGAENEVMLIIAENEVMLIVAENESLLLQTQPGTLHYLNYFNCEKSQFSFFLALKYNYLFIVLNFDNDGRITVRDD